MLSAGAVVLGLASLRGQSHEAVVGANTLVNPSRIIDANNSPTLVRNPAESANLVVVHRADRPNFSGLLNWSTDGGSTWSATELPLPSGLDRPFAPDASFSPDGALYVTYANLTGAGNVPDNLWLSRSDDGGRTLSPPVRVSGRLGFQGRVVAAPDGTVHVTWLQAAEVGLLRFAGPAPGSSPPGPSTVGRASPNRYP